MRVTCVATATIVLAAFLTSTPAVASICRAQAIQPQAAGVESFFDSITGTGPTDLWAAGAYRPHGSGYHALIEHYDGANWTAVPASPENNVNLTSIAAFSTSDAWAVGSKADKSGNIHFFAIRWNGSTWSEVKVPSLGGADEELASVAVDPMHENDVWAIGSSLPGYAHGPSYLVVWHRSGEGWKLYAWRSPHFGLSSITVSATGQAWAVGAMTGRKPFVFHWDGQTWTSQPAPYKNSSGLLAVDALDDNDVWATGFAGDHPLIEHFDGQTWSIHRNPNPGATSSLSSVSAFSPGDVWAVGSIYLGGGQFKTLSDRWNGVWRITESRNPTSESFLNGVKSLGGYSAMSVGEYRGEHGLRHALSELHSCN